MPILLSVLKIYWAIMVLLTFGKFQQLLKYFPRKKNKPTLTYPFYNTQVKVGLFLFSENLLITPEP